MNVKLPVKLFLVILIVPFILSGCLPQVADQSVPVGKDEYVKGAVAAGFPLSLIYKGAQVAQSYGFSGKYGAIFMTGDSIDTVVKFYNDLLPTLGWQANILQGKASYTFNIKNDSASGNIIVNTAGDGKMTAITIAISPKAQ